MTDPEAAVPRTAADSGGPRGPRTLGRSTAVMAAGTGTSRVLGFVRNILLVAAIGVNAGAANAYEVANKIPNALFAILAAGVLNAALVPQIVRALERHGGERTVHRIVTVGAVLSLVATVVLTAAAPVLVRLYTSGWPPELVALATAFAFWCIPQLFFYGLYTLLGQVLNAREQFGPYMWAPALNNVIGIVGLVIYLVVFGPYADGPDGGALVTDWDAGRIALLAGVATLGIAAQALVLIIPLVKGGYRWRWTWRGPKGELSTVGVVAGWALAATLVEQVAVMLTSRVATAANPGNLDPDIAGNAAFYNALILYLLPHSLVTVSLITALYPAMSRYAAAGDMAGLRSQVSRGVRVASVFGFFATAVMVILAPLIVRIALPTESVAVVDSVALVLRVLALGLVPLGVMVLMKFVFFALEDARPIFFIHIAMAIAWVGTAYLVRETLPNGYWAAGVALGMTLQNLVAVAMRGGGLRRRMGGLDGRRIGRTLVRSSVAMVPAALVGWLLVTVLPEPSTSSVVSGALSAAVICVAVAVPMLLIYGTGLRLLRVDELTDVIEPLQRRLRRRVR